MIPIVIADFVIVRAAEFHRVFQRQVDRNHFLPGASRGIGFPSLRRFGFLGGCKMHGVDKNLTW